MGALVAALSTGVASARPENCNDTIDFRKISVTTVCSSGSGQHRAVAVCEDAGTGERSFQYGKWENATTVSRAFCQGAQYVSSSGLDTKN
ncbi:hypothetical protein F3087_32000 [Nocardia colli]|uniref:Uncharacterized protein n=1 Tax=Nocardia colli TaxID=2545717 RepID=A0A5N0E5C5_9NOCA|nr:hypothetical protein [Nocardia colli]KAA8884617.1 hypothetical protein F3087_32000 [Nocardia colli]